jgi:anti-sigma B factor antagonist
MPHHNRLDVSTHIEHESGVVAVAGEIDLATVGPFRQAISDLVNGGLVHLVIDLSAVTFIDSTGLGVLVGARKRVRDGGGSLRLVCTHHRVLRLLAVTGLAQAMPVHASTDEALAVGRDTVAAD